MKYGIISKEGYVPLHVREAEELVIYDTKKGINKVPLYGIAEKQYPGLELLNMADTYGITTLYTGQKLRGLKLKDKFLRFISGKRNIAAEGKSVDSLIEELEPKYKPRELAPQPG